MTVDLRTELGQLLPFANGGSPAVYRGVVELWLITWQATHREP